MKSCVETDKQALLNLKSDFIDNFELLSSWKHEVDCCEWNGISCNYLTGHVTKLQVPSNGSGYLEGNISSSLCDLQHLTLLNLSSNSFGGNKIPKCIGSLNQLRELILSNAYLGGAIPHELWNLSNIQTLDLGYNYDLIVNDLEWISNLSSLRLLDLSGVNLSQAIDWQLSLSRKAPPTLRELMLSDADLVGIISLQLGNLSDLETLNLRGNHDLIVNDLKWLSHLSSLRNLDLSYVNLSQAIDWQLSLSRKAPPTLRELILSYADLVGIISLQLGNLSDLETLDLSGNHDLIVNDLKWLSHLSSLRHLDLSYVNLSQAIDWQLSLSRKAPPTLRELILSDADLVGIISLQLGNLSDLETLDLRGNDDLIVNDLKWLSHLSSLRHLDLSGINLSQAIDWQSSLSKMSSLFELNLDACALPNVNPKSLIHNNYSTSLTSLNLASNDLNTSILYWVSNISKTFIEIDLYGNTFQLIPAGIFSNMNSLKSLGLSSTSIQHIASDAFTNATSLESLDLSGNNLGNDIGKTISNLCQLRELDLSYNFLGPLSDLIPQLHCVQHSIETLDFTNNPFRGGSFPDFSKFSSLATLYISNTNLNGPIPQSFGHLPYLLSLDISQNNLSGPFPKLHELSSLESLYMSDNKLKGMVNEVHLSNLPNLYRLDVSNNFLSFNFSSNWVPPFRLQFFFARSCNFSMGFPMWLKHQRELGKLDISIGSISDSIPEWIWLFPSLSYLNISHNKIYGELPRSLSKSVLVWDFSFNNLSGLIPHFSPQVRGLVLSNNKFSGSISSLCATLQSQLCSLDISSNLMSGKLPHCWGQFLKLKVLVLANNNFSGMIPASIGTLKNIETIHLNNNNFSGEIPSLRHSPNLQLIDFGQNNLHGKLPSWIGNYLPNLIVLRLQANKFHGNMPISLCKLSLLQILDISQNNISGTIPHCFNNLSVISNLTFPRDTISYRIQDFFIHKKYLELVQVIFFLDNAMLNWKGEDVKYDKNLGLMTAIDLSSNHLTGEIPSSLTSLVALASLNLSRNNLTGFIPKNMGQIRMLESLDLSKNSLSGGIPISFSALSFLSFLNLSFNNLSGEIPQTTQLQTFDPSSYIGNNGLCGQPLTKGCPRNDDFNQNSSIDANQEDELITLGFFISMTLGFLVGFWGVCGTLIFKTSWKASYFQFFTFMNDWIYIHLAIFNAQMRRRFEIE